MLPARAVITVLLVHTVFLVGCGGGGGSANLSPSPGTKTLVFAAPSTYTDGTPLDPSTDLDPFELYVNRDGSFQPGDLPVAYVQIQPGTQLSYRWNLENLAPYLSRGTEYYVSLRAVAKGGGVKSDFSDSAPFTL